MNRLLQLARQMHQRRMNDFYLAPDERESSLAQQLTLGAKGNASPPPLYRDDAFDDEAEDSYGFDEPDAYDPGF